MLNYVSEHKEGLEKTQSFFDGLEKEPDFLLIYNEDDFDSVESYDLEKQIKDFKLDHLFPIECGVVRGICTEKGGGGGFDLELFKTISFLLTISFSIGITNFLNGLFSEAGKDFYSFLKEKVKKGNVSFFLSDRGNFWFLSGLSGQDIDEALRMIPTLEIEYGTFVYDVHQKRWVKIN